MIANHAREDMRLAKITIDFLGAIPKGDMTIATRVVRAGKRIELLEGVLSHGGQDVASARAWRINFQQGRVPPTSDQMPPNMPPPQKQEFFAGLENFGYGQAIEWRFVKGGFNDLGPGAAWTRPRVPLIEGEEMTGLQRLLVVADAANGLSAELPLEKFLFVPPSLTVTIQRFPKGQWVFIDAQSEISSDGVGETHALLADEKGFLGSAAQCLLVTPR
jgi:hypothetical protein